MKFYTALYWNCQLDILCPTGGYHHRDLQLIGFKDKGEETSECSSVTTEIPPQPRCTL